MKITIAHHRSKQETRESVDRAFNDLFQGVAGIPLQILVQQRTWEGDTLKFALTAKLAGLSSPIRGSIEVTDADLTLDVDWGLLNRLVPEKAAGELLRQRIKGLLK
jgi:Putative polyhydroxyalkanoic acid system protein (PHA_gran_rgn)